MTQLIGITGAKRSGKDTVAEILVNEYGYRRLAFADAIKDALYALDPIVIENLNASESYSYRLSELVDSQGWEVAKEVHEVRRLLQHMGLEAIRQFDENFWVNIVARQLSYYSKIVVTDVRFLNEVDMIKGAGGEVYRVRRDSVENHGDTHASENELSDYWFKEIPNNGTLKELEIIVGGIT